MLGERDDSQLYDLQDLLGGGARCSGNYVSAKELNRPDFHLLIEKKFVSLPENLQRQFDNVQCRNYMGLFPELRRVWVAIDNVLYLWDYEINEFETACQLANVITAVGLIKPPEGLFLDEVHYLMVVCTVATVYLFSVETEQRPLIKRFPVRLRDVQYHVSTDGCTFRCVVGTSDGRIFLGGQDGHILELQYQTTSMFNARRKIRKKNHTKRLIEAFAPSFVIQLMSYFARSLVEDPLLNLVYDPERQWIYAHHESDTIQVFNVAKGFEVGPRLTDIANIVNTMCVASAITDRRVMKIISLHPVQLMESKSICLVAITNTSCRLYFSVQCSYSTRTPVSIKIDYVRLPPNTDITQSLAQPPKPSEISATHSILHLHLPLSKFSANAHMAYYARGFMLSANAISDLDDSLLCTSVDVYALRNTLSANEYPKEKAHVMHVDGRTWDIREVDPETTLPISVVDSEENKPRHFLLLGREGIRVLCKQRPIDELMYLLRLEIRDIKYFVETYGQDQVCAWLLAIVCQNTGIVHPSLVPNEACLNINLAKRHFFFYGGAPIRQPTTKKPADLGSVVTPSTLQRSGCFRGLELYTKRLIAPFWKRSLLVRKNTHFELGIQEPVLQTAQRELAKLIQFNDEWHPPTDAMKDRSVDHTQIWLQEKPILLERFQVTKLILEAVRFTLILIRMRLPEVASTLLASQKEIPNELATQPFEYLVTEQGRNFCGQVATFLVQHAAMYYPTESLSPQLREHCPTLLHIDDIYTAMVLEKLEFSNTPNMLSICEEALHIALGVAGKLKSRQFFKICEKFVSLAFARGVLDLALQRAMETDLEDLALAYIEDGKPANDPRALLLSQRQECYDAVLRAFDALNQQLEKAGHDVSLESHRASTQARALESQDKLWHFTLYEWYAKKSPHCLLDLKTPYLEDWLNALPIYDMEEYVCMSMFEKQKLLSQYFVIQKKFEQASMVLFNIALAVSEQLSLDERIEFLKEASQTVKASNNTELQSNIRDFLDVALVQQSILHQVHSSQVSPHEIADLQTLYAVADEHRLVAYQLRMLAMSEDPESLGRDALLELWRAVFDPWLDPDRVSMTQLEAQLNEVLGGSARSGSPVYAPGIWVPVLEDVGFAMQSAPDFSHTWWFHVAVDRCAVDIEAIFMALKSYGAQLIDRDREKQKFVVRDMAYCLELWKNQLPPGYDSSVWESARASALVFAEQLDLTSLFYF